MDNNEHVLIEANAAFNEDIKNETIKTIPEKTQNDEIISILLGGEG